MRSKRSFGWCAARWVAYFLVLAVSLAFTVSVEGVAPASPSASGSLMPEVMVSTFSVPEYHRYRPQVAFNSQHNEYLVVWHNTWSNGDRMVYARRLDIQGRPIGQPFALSNVWVDQVHPAVAYNATDDVYFVVWMYDVSGNNTRYEIYGSIIPWNAANFGAIFKIKTMNDYTLWKPSAAWNNLDNEYLVTYDAFYVSNPSVPYGIGYRRVFANGTLDSTEDKFISNNAPTDSDLVYNAGGLSEYFMVYAYTTGSPGIYATRLQHDFSYGETFVIYPHPASNPTVGSNHKVYYLVAWEYAAEVSPFSHYVIAYCLNKDGDSYGSVLSLGDRGNDYYLPDVEASHYSGVQQQYKDDYLLVAQSTLGETHLEGYHIDCSSYLDGVRVMDEFQIYEDERTVRTASIAGGSAGFLIAYESRYSGATTWQHIFASKFWHGTVYSPYVVR